MLWSKGPLDAVSNLKINTTVIMWDPPFSLNLTNVEPDIVYCVEVYDTSCEMRSNIISDCNVTLPHYTFQFLTSGYTHEVVVTPRSNVEGAMNGSKLVVEGNNIPIMVYLITESYTNL